MRVGWVIQQLLQARRLLRKTGEEGCDLSIQSINPCKLRSGFVASSALQKGLSIDNSLLLQNRFALGNQTGIADVIRGLDIVSKRVLQSSDCLVDSWRRLNLCVYWFDHCRLSHILFSAKLASSASSEALNK